MSTLEDEFSFKSAARPPKCLAGLAIMLVDDSRSVSEVIRMMAIRSGARIRRADCLASAQRHMMFFRPDIVITDLGLPDGTGVELAHIIAEKVDPAPSILMLSAAEEDVTREAAEAAGADGFLIKPISSLGVFQDAILKALPGRGSGAPEWDADFAANLSQSDVLAQDLENVLDLFEEAARENDTAALKFGAQFLIGVALTAGLDELVTSAEAVIERLAQGHRGRAAGSVVIDALSRTLQGDFAKAG